MIWREGDTGMKGIKESPQMRKGMMIGWTDERREGDYSMKG
jgi:hypothetical protein